MRKFKVNRLKYDENQYLIQKIKVNQAKQKQKHNITKFFHTLERKCMTDVLTDLRTSNPTYSSIKLPSTFTTRERMEMIEEDFENCISNNIMS